jgi:hypothetical protein
VWWVVEPGFDICNSVLEKRSVMVKDNVSVCLHIFVSIVVSLHRSWKFRNLLFGDAIKNL